MTIADHTLQTVFDQDEFVLIEIIDFVSID